MGVYHFLGVTDFYHSYFTTVSSIAPRIGTGLPYYPAVCKTDTVMSNRYLFGIPIRTSLNGLTILVQYPLTLSASKLYPYLFIPLFCFQWQRYKFFIKISTNIIVAFLSTPVHTHGGLICIAFCPSVCPSVRCHLTKTQDQKIIHILQSMGKKVKFFQDSVNKTLIQILEVTGRWAHFNVKLHFFPYLYYFKIYMALPTYMVINGLVNYV